MRPDTCAHTHLPSYSFFSPLPPTPRPTTKRKRIMSDAKEDEPTTKKKSGKSVANRGDPDPDGVDLDRRTSRQSKLGVQKKNLQALPSPRPSSPPPPSPTPEPRPPSRRGPSSHPTPSHTIGQREPRQRNTAHHDTTRRSATQQRPSPRTANQRDTSNGQSSASSGHSTSNASAARPLPASPSHVFAAALKDMEVLDGQVNDLNDLNIGEDDNPKRNGKKGVPEEDDGLDEEEEDDVEGEDEHPGNNHDDEELSAEAIDDLMTVIHSRTKQKFSLTCVPAFSLFSFADYSIFTARSNQIRNISLATSRSRAATPIASSVCIPTFSRQSLLA